MGDVNIIGDEWFEKSDKFQMNFDMGKAYLRDV
jgi:hypothetical protein